MKKVANFDGPMMFKIWYHVWGQQRAIVVLDGDTTYITGHSGTVAL